MQRESFPVKLRATEGQLRPETLLDYCQGFGVIAQVRVRTPVAEYPLRVGERVIYPTGTFTTTLTGPELTKLASDGEILSCARAAVYHLGRPFQAAMNVLLEETRLNSGPGQSDVLALCKLVRNSIGGKCGQRAGRWRRLREADQPGWWGDEHELLADESKVARLRWICGFCYIYEEDEFPKGPHTYAMSYLTAYGRLLMRSLREVCPAKSVVSQDTDGLWVTDSAIQALTSLGLLADPGPGKLRKVASASTAVFYGPRHYIADGQLVMSGLSGASLNPRTGLIDYQSTQPLWGRKDKTAPSTVLTRFHSTLPPTADFAGTVGADGWISPPVRSSSWADERGK